MLMKLHMCLLLLFNFTDKDMSLTYYLPFSFNPIPIKLSLKTPKRKPFLPMSQKPSLGKSSMNFKFTS